VSPVVSLPAEGPAEPGDDGGGHDGVEAGGLPRLQRWRVVQLEHQGAHGCEQGQPARGASRVVAVSDGDVQEAPPDPGRQGKGGAPPPLTGEPDRAGRRVVADRLGGGGELLVGLRELAARIGLEGADAFGGGQPRESVRRR